MQSRRLLASAERGCHRIQQSMVITHFQLGRRERAIHKVNCKRTSKYTAISPAVKTRQPFQFSCLIVQINGLFNSVLSTYVQHRNQHILWTEQAEICMYSALIELTKRKQITVKKEEMHEVLCSKLYYMHVTGNSYVSNCERLKSQKQNTNIHIISC